MKNLKFIFWAIIVGFVVLFIFQNQEFITAKQSFRINLLADEYRSPEIPNAVLFLVCFVFGFIISYFLSLSKRFKANKTIRELNTKSASQLEEIADLKSQVESFQSSSSDTNEESDENDKQNA